jgi:glutamate 5-kinase
MHDRDERIHHRKESISCVRRAVIKVGSGVLTKDLDLNTEIIRGLACEISRLIKEKGLEILLVSSGAIASGLRRVGLSRHPVDIPQKQATAAVGQSRPAFGDVFFPAEADTPLPTGP